MEYWGVEDGGVLWTDGGVLWADGGVLWTDGGELWTDGGELWTDGGVLWTDGVPAVVLIAIAEIRAGCRRGLVTCVVGVVVN